MIKRIFWNLYFLTFLNGFLLASLFYFKMEANYEKEVFQAIRENVNSNITLNDPQDSVVVKVMHACHDLLNTQIIKTQVPRQVRLVVPISERAATR